MSESACMFLYPTGRQAHTTRETWQDRRSDRAVVHLQFDLVYWGHRGQQQHAQVLWLGERKDEGRRGKILHSSDNCPWMWLWHRMSGSTIFLLGFEKCLWKQPYCLLRYGLVCPNSVRPYVIVRYFIDCNRSKSVTDEFDKSIQIYSVFNPL